MKEYSPAATDSTSNFLQAVHQALFHYYFPINRLDIAANLKPVIITLAGETDTAMWNWLNSTSGASVEELIVLMGYPNKLLATLPPDEAQALKQSTNPAVIKFLAKGIAALSYDEIQQLFSIMIQTGPFSLVIYISIRQVYLGFIWNIPEGENYCLATALCNINPPQTFVPDMPAYVAKNKPAIPPSRLLIKDGVITHKDGPIDYLVIGSGPGGATMAYELWKNGKRVVLVEKGPFVVWGSMVTMSYGALMFNNDALKNQQQSIFIRSGQALGGGSTVNIDLAFSPLEASVQYRINNWIQEGLLSETEYSGEKIAAAYRWVREKVGTRQLAESEINRDNGVLWNGANAYGCNPSLYHLNRFVPGYSPSVVDDKRDAARQLLLEAATDTINPLSIIPDTSALQIVFDNNDNCKVTGLNIQANTPWTTMGNTVVDPCNLQMQAGQKAFIPASNVVLSAGTIGSATLLLQTAKALPAVFANDRIGKGLIIHPSTVIMGEFNEEIRVLQGLDSSVYMDAFGVSPGFIFETMGGLPAYGAVVIPGNGEDAYNVLSQFNRYAGFGVMLVDESCDENCVTLDAKGNFVLNYALTPADSKRFVTGLCIGIRMMFAAGAKKVIIASSENFLGIEGQDPAKMYILTSADQASLVEMNLQFIPNRTIVSAAHLQASNRLGTSSATGVVSPNFKVWNNVAKKEVANFYLMDSSVFNGSVGANPMQSIYTLSKILADRIIAAGG